METADGTALGTVETVIVEVLGLDRVRVVPGATLFGDLGVQSIDLLDILLALEESTGVTLRFRDIADYVRGGLAESDFADEQGLITTAGLEQVRRTMPQVDAQARAGDLGVEAILFLFTVENLANLVAQQVRAAR